LGGSDWHCLCILWYKGQVQSLAAYVAETREELKKCAWPSWDELKGSTALIIIMVALLGGFVVVVDAALSRRRFIRCCREPPSSPSRSGSRSIPSVNNF